MKSSVDGVLCHKIQSLKRLEWLQVHLNRTLHIRPWLYTTHTVCMQQICNHEKRALIKTFGIQALSDSKAFANSFHPWKESHLLQLHSTLLRIDTDRHISSADMEWGHTLTSLWHYNVTCRWQKLTQRPDNVFRFVFCWQHSQQLGKLSSFMPCSLYPPQLYKYSGIQDSL